MMQINENRPDLEILSHFEGMTKKIHVRYSKCGHDVWIKAKSALKGPRTGLCSTCAKSIAGKRKVKSHDEFMDDFHNKNTHNIRVIGKYTGCKDPIEVECLDCGLVWTPQASDMLANHGCPMCGGVYNYSPKEYKQLAESKSPGTIVLSDYINGRTDIHRK